MSRPYLSRSQQLLLVLAGFFVTNALVAEFMGVKIFSLEKSLGFAEFPWRFLGIEGTLQFTAGVLLWPVVFTLTDVINEYYGHKVVRFLSFLTVGLIIYGFIMIFCAINLVPAAWWPSSYTQQGVPDAQSAYAALFGQGLWIIGGSMIAFLVGQVTDAYIFFRIRQRLGEKNLWIRSLVSTLFSQFLDSFVVIYVAFVLGPQHWSIPRFLALATVSFTYKLVLAILLLPVLYLVHRLVSRYLGETETTELKRRAAASGMLQK